MHQLAGLVRRHWGFAVVLAAGIALRVATSLAYWPALLYVHTPKYLEGAGQSDPVGYRVLLIPLDRLGGLALVAIVQHLIGLGLGVALYVMLVRRGVPRWLGVIAAAPVLLDAYQLQIEQMILPDLLFEAMIAVGIIVLAMILGSQGRPAPAAQVADFLNAAPQRRIDPRIAPAVRKRIRGHIENAHDHRPRQINAAMSATP